MKKFFYVIRNANGAATYETKEAAIEYAKKYASERDNEAQFYVLEALTVVGRPIPDVEVKELE